MRSRGLSKSKVMAGVQCQKRLYLEVNHPELAEVSRITQMRFGQGKRLGEVARRMYGNGVLVGHDDDLAQAVAVSKALLDNSPADAFFEATFSHGSVLVRADVLQRGKQGLRLVEVKSSTKVKSQHLQDCAIQSWVIEGAGYPLERIELAHVDTSFVYQGAGNYAGILLHNDLTAEVRPLMKAVPDWVDQCQQTLAGALPNIAVGEHCRFPHNCPFIGHCSPPQPEYPISMLHHGGRIVQELIAEGINDVRAIPEGRLRKKVHRRIRWVTLSGQYELDDLAGKMLSRLPYPRYYLDFETVQFVVPEWAGTRPYNQLPFQWSCHIEEEDGNISHVDFLDTSGEPPMRRFAVSLVDALGDGGPILVYNMSFEKGRVHELAGTFPDLAGRLHAIAGRMVDLLPIAQEHYYHPAMKGSWSIKAVLPTIAPELNYQGLVEVQDGTMAQSAYLEAISSNTAPDRRDRLTQALREYCKLDTLAMVKIAHFFEGKTP